jgi:hypothetical protein
MANNQSSPVTVETTQEFTGGKILNISAGGATGKTGSGQFRTQEKSP